MKGTEGRNEGHLESLSFLPPLCTLYITTISPPSPQLSLLSGIKEADQANQRPDTNSTTNSTPSQAISSCFPNSTLESFFVFTPPPSLSSPLLASPSSASFKHFLLFACTARDTAQEIHHNYTDPLRRSSRHPSLAIFSQPCPKGHSPGRAWVSMAPVRAC